ncbi:ADYC domain-containing protein [Falsiroseomonas ponticola]|uniref:ADYC domain-containing protein n=1 Tax=Falsiroseomonas ponticola TaxID=2786951 RepID=UPI001932F921|nr:ADYC domain-containing protein [Roseomonas ponticola]
MRRLLALLLLLAGPAQAQDRPRLLGLVAEGGDFRADLSDGTHLRGADLVGAVLHLAGAELRIDSARRDATVPRAGDVWLFGISARAQGGGWQPLCAPDPAGESLAMPYPGEDGALRLTCSAGAIGKCIRFGYRPWASLPDGRPLAPFHAACTNMVRAAYGGPAEGEAGGAWTRNGMRIDVFDEVGIQSPDNDPGDAFEAGWRPDGAACLAHVRVPENGDLAAVLAAHPRLAALSGPAVCTREAAAAAGALVFNRSPRR